MFFGLATGGATLDLVSKHWIFQWRGSPGANPEWWVIPQFFGVQTALNNGALFGLGQGYQLVFAALSVVAFAAIVYWLFWLQASQDRWLTFSLGLISGGVFGNLYDRLGWGKLADTPDAYQHAVRDWILFRFGSFTWPNFNIADSLLVCGAAGRTFCARRSCGCATANICFVALARSLAALLHAL